MEVRDCKFCQSPAIYSPIERMENFGIKVYFCHPCQAEYLYFSRNDIVNEKPASYSLYTTINNKMYRWTTISGGGVNVWYVKNPGEPSVSINEGMEFVAHIKEIGPFSVNPQNIMVKLKIWLPFL